MVTASIFLSSLSSIWRKSEYLGALGYFVKTAAARLESGSANATRFSPETAAISADARPPAPMQAVFNFSLGGLYPRNFREGTLPKPAAGIAPARSVP